ncbi:prephenate dehydrogenase/arogenate dehydrogenase family protein [Leucothrix pacifica]|uniref:prephenate dehydrogenase n=1 Tax=Leucothrix pacifica TaxID=1247513 RepID=A0A317CNM7_9GAMM|nr:prephenate dehydrogenase/arogenate dehydrogenase family protein [Leucothrix pacifica]PWQ99083.1 prephenate dehydrogenase/arogenate dehydrogenase family protein [Leucothrix pacifica]
MIKKLVIFGVGLIGGSLALALKRANYCEEIVGCSRQASGLEKAVELGVIDRYTLDPAEAVKDADMILLAVPMGAMASVLSAIKGHTSADAVITDAGSAKASVVAAAESVYGTVPENFVPGHPIAGAEKSGVEAALIDLYVDHKVIVTPLAHTSRDAELRVIAMWEAAGADVESMDVENHDRVLAATSHLPHALAFALVDTLSRSEVSEDIFHYAAGGFRDFTRIASSDPVMWRDICLENRDAILESIEAFQKNLSSLHDMVAESDSSGIMDMFSHAKSARDAYLKKQS